MNSNTWEVLGFSFFYSFFSLFFSSLSLFFQNSKKSKFGKKEGDLDLRF